MTREETEKIIFIIRANYPENYAKLSGKDLDLLLAMWEQLLKDYSYEQVSLAVQNYLVNDTYGRAPKIGQIIDSLQKVHMQNEISPLEAWNMVSRAIRNGIYGAQKEFDKLPPVVQKTIGSAQYLYDEAISGNYNVDVAKGQFLKAYAIVAQREKENAKLPQAVRERLQQSETLKIEG